MVAYQIIGILGRDGLCYIVIKAQGEVQVVRLRLQHAGSDVSHWGGQAGPSACKR